MDSNRRMAVVALLAALAWPPAHADNGALPTAEVRAAGAAVSAAYDGVVEAVRQTAIAAQVSGAVVDIAVKAGERVKAGQVLVRIDAHAAQQSVAASEAEVRSARASLELATRDFERQQQLFERNYTSRAAMERAEAQFKATQAQVSAQIAQAEAARAQSGFFVVRAPYAGVIADVPVMLGDMALPGRVLLTLYDPGALRVTASVPQTAVSGVPSGPQVKAEIPGLPADRAWFTPSRVELLPTVDPGTHTVVVRLSLPANATGAAPGMFARVWLPGEASEGSRLWIPVAAVVRRTEMTGVYVVDARGRPNLRQVRLGRAAGSEVEVLSGVNAGERVAIDPHAAARLR